QPEATHDVLGRDRVIEVLSGVVDAREPGAGQEVLTEHLLPKALHGLELREESMSPEVEPIAVELDGLRDPSEGSVGLEHRTRPPSAPDNVGSRQSRGASAEDRRADAGAGVARTSVAGSDSLRYEFLD